MSLSANTGSVLIAWVRAKAAYFLLFSPPPPNHLPGAPCSPVPHRQAVHNFLTRVCSQPPIRRCVRRPPNHFFLNQKVPRSGSRGPEPKQRIPRTKSFEKENLRAWGWRIVSAIQGLAHHVGALQDPSFGALWEQLQELASGELREQLQSFNLGRIDCGNTSRFRGTTRCGSRAVAASTRRRIVGLEGFGALWDLGFRALRKHRTVGSSGALLGFTVLQTGGNSRFRTGRGERTRRRRRGWTAGRRRGWRGP